MCHANHLNGVGQRLLTSKYRFCSHLQVLYLWFIFLSGAHHIDLRASTADDPDWLVEQRASEIEMIKGWIDTYRRERKSVFDIYSYNGFGVAEAL